MGFSGRLDLSGGKEAASLYPLEPCDAEGGECLTMQGPETVHCGLFSSLPGPIQMPASGAPPSLLLVFLLGGFAGPLPHHFSPASAAITHQCRLGILATQGPWDNPEPLFSGEPLCSGRLEGGLVSLQVPLELPLCLIL